MDLDYNKYLISTSLRSDFELLDFYFIDLATSVAVFQVAERRQKPLYQRSFLNCLNKKKETNSRNKILSVTKHLRKEG